MHLIETSAALAELCDRLRGETYITVDTEFVRERTYFSQLCLVQVGWTNDAAVIDPLAEGMDLAPFLDLMQDRNVLKVFHAGRQDLEIFYNLSGRIPTPVFDTQIAAQVCGFGASIGYDNLVRAVTGVELDKSSRLTDWSIRPLDLKQLEYALRDVTFLLPCYEYLKKYLDEHGRQDWIKEETDALCDETLYRVDPDEVWQKLHYTAHTPRFLQLLKDLAAWRERRAIRSNVPRGTILRDDLLLNIAARAPETPEEMLNVRNMRPALARGRIGTEILEVVKAARAKPTDRRLRQIDNDKHRVIPPRVGALLEVLRLLLKVNSEQAGVVPRLIAGEAELRDLACGTNDRTNKALQGWRYDIFGKDALGFRHGTSSLAFDTKTHRIVIEKREKKAATD
jgi:ribonuclease D